jgi:hypothetical protein
MTAEAMLKPLSRLVGAWTTEATHPAVPGVVVHGQAKIEWLEGERFLIHRAGTDHPDFPDSISIVGFMGLDRIAGTAKETAAAASSHLQMHYFDSRGVFRVYELTIDDNEWRIWREAPGFSQRFTGTFSDRGDTIIGLWQMCQDNVHWQDDLQITYRRS